MTQIEQAWGAGPSARYEDLAARMKVPLGTMKSWIRRAMIKLKSCLEQ